MACIYTNKQFVLFSKRRILYSSGRAIDSFYFFHDDFWCCFTEQNHQNHYKSHYEIQRFYGISIQNVFLKKKLSNPTKLDEYWQQEFRTVNNSWEESEKQMERLF